MKLVKQSFQILSLGLSNEWADKERTLSPVLFALLFVLLLWFSFGELPSSMGVRVFVAEVFLAMFFALQIAFMRIYEPELEDEALTLFRSIPVHPVAIFLGKIMQCMVVATIISATTIAIGGLFLGESTEIMTNASFLTTLGLVMFGLSSLGVLLSGLTARTSAKQILFPILFFPLTAPVMILGVQSAILSIEDGKLIAELSSSWLGLLLVFDLIYFTLGILVFDELLKPE